MHWVAHHYSVNCLAVIYLPRMDECYYYLWRDTTSELWTPVLLINLIKPQLQTCYFLQTSLFLPHIRLILLLQHAGGIDTLTVELGQNTLIFCVQAPRSLLTLVLRRANVATNKLEGTLHLLLV